MIKAKHWKIKDHEQYLSDCDHSPRFAWRARAYARLSKSFHRKGAKNAKGCKGVLCADIGRLLGTLMPQRLAGALLARIAPRLTSSTPEMVRADRGSPNKGTAAMADRPGTKASMRLARMGPILKLA